MTSTRRTLASAAVAMAMLGLAACGSSSPKAAASTTSLVVVTTATTTSTLPAPTAPTLADASGKPCKAEQPSPLDAKDQPAVPVPVGPPPTKLVIQDLRPGTGAAAVAGGQVTVQYVLVACSTGQMVQTSWTDQPFTGILENGALIPGWVQGIPGMKVGGRRLLVVPPALGYGASGQQGIAPNETLVFVVDLLGVSSSASVAPTTAATTSVP